MVLPKGFQVKSLDSDVVVTLSHELLSSSEVLKSMMDDINDNQVIPLNLDSRCLNALLYWEKNQEIENEESIMPLLYAVDHLHLNGFLGAIKNIIFEVMYPVGPTMDDVGALMGITGQELEHKLYEIIDSPEPIKTES